MYYTSLDIPRQPTCIKLGIRELYQPIQSCRVACLVICNKFVQYPDRTAFAIAGLMLSCLGTAAYKYIVKCVYCQYHYNVPTDYLCSLEHVQLCIAVMIVNYH